MLSENWLHSHCKVHVGRAAFKIWLERSDFPYSHLHAALLNTRSFRAWALLWDHLHLGMNQPHVLQRPLKAPAEAATWSSPCSIQSSYKSLVTDYIESFRATQAVFCCHEKIFARFLGLPVNCCFTYSIWAFVLLRMTTVALLQVWGCQFQ